MFLIAQAKSALLDSLNRQARRRLTSYPYVQVSASAKWKTARQARLFQNCKLTIGDKSIIEGTIVAERDGVEISIGQNTYIGNSTIACAARIDIGDDVLISWGCSIVDHNSHSLFWTERAHDVAEYYEGKKNWADVKMMPVSIGDKAWIGLNTIILKGVEIGQGAIVGAGSVVTRSVAPWTLVAGNPAKFIRFLTPNDTQGETANDALMTAFTKESNIEENRGNDR
jgi:acetyltransferase-like isoleucine patch superfamily enzyme